MSLWSILLRENFSAVGDFIIPAPLWNFKGCPELPCVHILLTFPMGQNRSNILHDFHKQMPEERIHID